MARIGSEDIRPPCRLRSGRDECADGRAGFAEAPVGSDGSEPETPELRWRVGLILRSPLRQLIPTPRGVVVFVTMNVIYPRLRQEHSWREPEPQSAGSSPDRSGKTAKLPKGLRLEAVWTCRVALPLCASEENPGPVEVNEGGDAMP